MVYLGILIQLAVTCIGLYPPPIQRVFLARTVRADWWVASLPFALLLWGFDEGRKWLIRRYPGGFFFFFLLASLASLLRSSQAGWREIRIIEVRAKCSHFVLLDAQRERENL